MSQKVGVMSGKGPSVPPDGQDGEPESERGKKRSREPDRFARTRQLLALATPLAALVMTVGSALVKLLVEKLPTLQLQPIAVALVVFFAFLSFSALLQLFLHWRDLSTRRARNEFVRTLVFGAFLFFVMVSGMLTRYFWELSRSGRSVVEADLQVLVLPTLVSVMVFYPLWTLVSGATKNFFAIVAAFQNGFFWQTLFSGLGPLPGPPGP
jgi:magnesium-transporting ATPase (P-type)